MQSATFNMHTRNFIINQTKVIAAMQAKGYKTIEELATALGVHRNTIRPYLTKQRGLPNCLDRLLHLLDLTPAEAIVENFSSKQQLGLEIVKLLAEFVRVAPSNTYVLFGSRAKDSYKKYSDYDVGVYSQNTMKFSEFSKLIDLSADWSVDKHYDVNLTNLNLADNDFLSSLAHNWVFLGGNIAAWVNLQKKAGISLYE